MKQCYLCNSAEYKKREGKVRDNNQLDIFECEKCGLVFLSEDTIGDEFYTSSQMHNNSIIDNISTEYAVFNKQRVEFLKNLILNKNILDFGSGYAGFLIEAKKFAKSVTGIEIETQVQDIYIKNNIPLFRDLGEIEQIGGGDTILLPLFML